jgi:hypothetical protein
VYVGYGWPGWSGVEKLWFRNKDAVRCQELLVFIDKISQDKVQNGRADSRQGMALHCNLI